MSMFRRSILVAHRRYYWLSSDRVNLLSLRRCILRGWRCLVYWWRVLWLHWRGILRLAVLLSRRSVLWLYWRSILRLWSVLLGRWCVLRLWSLRSCLEVSEVADRCGPSSEGLAVLKLLDVVQTASDSLLSGGIVWEEVDGNPGVDPAVDLGLVQDGVQPDVNDLRLVLRGGSEDPVAFALDRERLSIGRPDAVSVVDRCRNDWWLDSAPGLRYAFLDGRRDCGIDLLLGEYVRLRDEDGGGEFRLLAWLTCVCHEEMRESEPRSVGDYLSWINICHSFIYLPFCFYFCLCDPYPYP